MSSHVVQQKLSIYEDFCDAAWGELTAEFDSEKVYLLGEGAVKAITKQVTQEYKAGVLDMDYRTVRVIAAIAFWDTAQDNFEPWDYPEHGGEKYSD